MSKHVETNCRICHCETSRTLDSVTIGQRFFRVEPLSCVEVRGFERSGGWYLFFYEGLRVVFFVVVGWVVSGKEA